jgi:acyl-CoA thioesterase I
MLVMVAMSPYLKRRWLLRVRNVATWLALALMLMACPPFAWIVDVIFAAVFLIWFITWNRSAKGRIWLRMRTPTMVPIFVLLLGLPAVEWSHRRMPVIEGEANDHLVVIGDSISAGLGSRVLQWPAIMQQKTKLDVRNLSRPGTTMSDGESMAEMVTAEDHLILIELGGNDLIAGESSDVFAQALNAVLARLAVPGRTLVMFELPLLPDRVAYGQIQRRLCAQYRVWLIPKRYLSGVIAGRDATSDGLHLTDIGARRMEAVVTRILLPVLKTRLDKPTVLATHP